MKRTQYSYSLNEEQYHGFFGSRNEAIDAAQSDIDYTGIVWTGEIDIPDPSQFVSASNVIDDIACADEFSGDWADDWEADTRPYQDDLTEMLQKTVAEWVEKHDLQPRFYNIVHGSVIVSTNSNPQRAGL